MKKLIFTFIAAMCCMAMNAQSTFEVGDIKYSVTGEYTVEVVAKDSKYTGSVVIPATVTNPDGGKIYNVTGIRNDAFEWCNNLTSITIPKGVTSIGASAFLFCAGLNSITIPEGVTSIGAQAFDNTGWYNEQKDGLLYLCNYLVGVKGVNTTTDIVIEDGTMTIADEALRGCNSLVSLTIPKSVTSIGDWAFPVINLNSITVDSENPVYDSRNNCNAIIETATNTLIAGCKNTIIPSDVTSIANNAFRSCDKLTSVTIPSGVTYIGNTAFLYCNGLKEIHVLATTPPTLGTNAFGMVPTGIPVYVPDVDAYKNISWGGFTNLIKYVDLPTAKEEAIAEINDAMKDITTFTEAEKQSIQLCKENINAATTLTEIKSNKDAALFIIDLRKYKDEAIAEINDAMKDITTFTEAEEQSIQLCKNNINAATTLKEIETTKEAALVIIELRPFKDKAIADLQTYFFNEEKIANPPMKEYADLINAATTVDEIQSIVNNIKAEINNYTKFTLGEWKYLLDKNDGEYTIVGDKLTFTDKDLYQSDYDFTANTLTYSRTFKNANWQPLYVPFTMSYDDWEGKFDVAAINNFHEYTDEKGQTIKTELEVRLVNSGTLKPNHPYLIKAHDTAAEPLQIELSTKEIRKSDEKSYSCSSMESLYTFTGTYQEMNELKANDYIFMSGGKLCKAEDDEVVLLPQRWYLKITSLGSQVDDANTSYAKPMEFDIKLLDDEATGIDEITVTRTLLKNISEAIYNLNGMRVNDNYNGIVIKNGKKVYQK